MTNREFDEIVTTLVKLLDNKDCETSAKNFISALFDYTKAAIAQHINVTPNANDYDRDEFSSLIAEANEVEKKRSEKHDKLVVETDRICRTCVRNTLPLIYPGFKYFPREVLNNRNNIWKMVKSYYQEPDHKSETMSKEMKIARHDLANWAWDFCVQLALENGRMSENQEIEENFNSRVLNEKGSVEDMQKLNNIYGNGDGAKGYLMRILKYHKEKEKSSIEKKKNDSKTVDIM